MRNVIPVFVAAGLFPFAWFSCIERSNPWDPVNVTACSREKAGTLKSSCASFLQTADSISAVVDSFFTEFIIDTAALLAVSDSNLRVAAANETIRSSNDTVEAFNASLTAPDSLLLKRKLDSLEALPLPRLHSGETSRQLTVLTSLQMAFESGFSAFRSECVTYRDSLKELEDSVRESLAMIVQRVQEYEGRVSAAFAAAEDSNGTRIAPYNETIVALNSSAAFYNDSVTCSVFQSRSAGWLSVADSVSAEVAGFETALKIDSAANGARADTNALVAERNKDILAANAAVDSSNRTAGEVDSLVLKSFLGYKTPYGEYRSFDTEAAVARDLVNAFIDSADTFPVRFIRARTDLAGASGGCGDSVKNTLQGIVASIDGYSERVRSANAAAGDSNALSVVPYNRQIADANDDIGAYNDSIAWLKTVRAERVVTSADSLRAKVASAQQGDTIFLADSVFVVGGGLQFNASGTVAAPIVIMGSRAGTTGIREPDGVILSSREHIYFHNITFAASSARGFKLENNSGTIVFDNCHFIDNDSYGLEVIDSDVELRNCTVLRNRSSGMRFATDAVGNRRLDMHNVLIAGNNQHGIEAVTMEGTIIASTISDNGGDGILLSVPSRPVAIINSMVTFNGGCGIRHTPQTDRPGLLTLENSNLYNNFLGEISADSSYRLSYLSVDPNYIDRLEGNYAIAPAGGIYELELKGIVIGWRRK
jgi:hypothetical protein